MTQGFSGFLLLLGAGCGCCGGCMADGDAGFTCVLFCLSIMMQIKILNSTKIKSTLLIFAEVVYMVLD